MTDADFSHDDGRVRADGSADPAHRVPLSYIDRSRRYYRSQGYERPYRWATNTKTPFSPLAKPLTDCRLAVITTSFPFERHDGPRPAKEVRATATDPPPLSMYTQDLFWHKDATHTDDMESFLPLRTLAKMVADGRIGSLADRFYSVPTTYSQRTTKDDAETIVTMCGDDDVDVVLLIPL